MATHAGLVRRGVHICNQVPRTLRQCCACARKGLLGRVGPLVYTLALRRASQGVEEGCSFHNAGGTLR